MSLASEFKVQVVGLTHADNYPENIYALNEVATSNQLNPEYMEPIHVVLVRNPNNEHDANAIEVHVTSLPSPMIGHIPAKVARQLAPSLDAGEIWESNIWKVAIHPDYPENPGIHVAITNSSQNGEPF